MKETKNEKINVKSLDELRRELEMAQKTYESAKEAVERKETEEAERKRAKLALEKENRKKVIEEKEEELVALISEYIKDYGSYKNCHHINGNAMWSHLYDWFF